VSVPGQVRVAVEAQAMAGDVSAGVDADGAHLGVVHPNARLVGCVRRPDVVHPKVPAALHDGSLQGAHVSAHAEVVRFQVYDGVRDQLSGAVEGDQTPSVCTVEVGAQLLQLLLLGC